MSMTGFGKKIAAYQDEVLAVRDLQRNDIEAVRARLFDREVALAPARRRLMPIWAYGFAAAAACGLVLFLLLPFGQESPLPGSEKSVAVTGQWLSAVDAPRLIAFSDKSRVRLQQGAAARILKEDGHNVHFLLEKGTAEVNVVHHEDTIWLLDCGPYTVSVIGTRFFLSWDPSKRVLDLRMIEGTVEVKGPMVEMGRRVSGRESFHANVASGRFTLQSNGTAPAADSAVRNGAETSESDSIGDAMSGNTATPASGNDPAASVSANSGSASNEVSNEVRKDVARKQRDSGRYTARQTRAKDDRQNIADMSTQSRDSVNWRELNRAGRFDEVVQEARAQGIANVLAGKPVSELMALADAARLKKEWQLSRDTYVAVRQRAPKSSNAQTAAFSIGRIAFDVQHDYAAASQWLQTYLHEAPTGRLAREALGRLMEAQQKTGNSMAARQSAAKYLQQFPDGPHAEVARGLQRK